MSLSPTQILTKLVYVHVVPWLSNQIFQLEVNIHLQTRCVIFVIHQQSELLEASLMSPVAIPLLNLK